MPDQGQEIEQYRPGEEDGVDYGFSEMHPDPDGEWVRYEDHLKALEASALVGDLSSELAGRLQTAQARLTQLEREYDEATQELATELADARGEADRLEDGLRGEVRWAEQEALEAASDLAQAESPEGKLIDQTRIAAFNQMERRLQALLDKGGDGA